MPRNIPRILSAVAIALATLPTAMNAQTTYIYTNNDISGQNSVSGFSVGSNGALTAVPGSPFLTGGSGSGGGYYASNKATASIAGSFFFASNSGSGSISAFAINPANGVLAALPG